MFWTKHKNIARFPLSISLICVVMLLIAACGGSSEPTPTPTKTPMAANDAAPPASMATNTPAPAAPAAPPEQPSANPTPAPVQTQQTATVNVDLLNVRSEPNTAATIVREANKSEQFVVLQTSQDGKWLQLAQNGQALGWAAAEFLDVKTSEVATQPPAGQAATTPQSSNQPAANPPAANSPNTNVASFEMKSPDFGAQAFLWWRTEVADRDLGLMRDAGFNWVKQTFAWETIEGAGRGQFDWSTADRVVTHVNDYGLRLLARVSSDPDKRDFWAGAPPGNADAFAAFVGVFAARYNCTPQAVGCIHAFQIWNEPNLAREWGGNRPDPAGYARFLQKAYQAIKAVHPQAIVISAGMAPTGSNDNNAMPDDVFYDQMYAAMGGNSAGYFDMLGVHGAGFAAPPELDPAQAAADKKYGGYRFFAFRHVEDIRAIMVKYNDVNKRIVLLEFGWTFDSVNPAYKWHGADAGITDRIQADYLKRAYEYASANWRPWIGLMNLLTMPNLDWLNDGNPQDEEQYWWAIMEPSQVDQLNFRAAYIVLCDYFNRQIGQFCKYDPARQ